MIGENPLMGSMYGTVMREIGQLLHEDPAFEIDCMAFNYTGWPFKTDIIPYPLYPWVGPPNKPLNIDDVLHECKPDTLLLIGPPFMFGWLPKFRKRKKYRVLLSTSFKSLPLDKYFNDLYSASDSVIVHSRFEKEALNAISKEFAVKLVSPGINTGNLRDFFQKPVHNDGRFRVACVAKDTPYTDIPVLLKAYGIVSKAAPEILLGVFSDAVQLQKWNIDDMLDVYGIKDKCVIMKPQPETNFGFPSMGAVYSSVDLMVALNQDISLNTAVLEAAYCDTPILTGRGGATEEYLPAAARRLEKTDIFIAPPSNTRYTVYDAVETADKILAQYALHLNRPPKRTIDKHYAGFDWKRVYKEWKEILAH